MTRLTTIDVMFLPAIWQLVSEYIEKSLKYANGKYDLDGVLELLKKRELLLWVVYTDNKIKGCFVTELIDYPKKRILMISFLGADEMEDVLCHLDAIKDYAKKHKAQGLEIFGRAGWEKTLSVEGFRKTHVVLGLNLD